VGEPEQRGTEGREALSSCRERLALAMTRLNQAHWELDRLVEEWLSRGRVAPARIAAAGSVLGWTLSAYREAFAEVVSALSGKDRRLG
jgi:hypothetical protein